MENKFDEAIKNYLCIVCMKNKKDMYLNTIDARIYCDDCKKDGIYRKCDKAYTKFIFTLITMLLLGIGLAYVAYEIEITALSRRYGYTEVESVARKLVVAAMLFLPVSIWSLKVNETDRNLIDNIASYTYSFLYFISPLAVPFLILWLIFLNEIELFHVIFSILSVIVIFHGLNIVFLIPKEKKNLQAKRDYINSVISLIDEQKKAGGIPLRLWYFLDDLFDKRVVSKEEIYQDFQYFIKFDNINEKLAKQYYELLKVLVEMSEEYEDYDIEKPYDENYFKIISIISEMSKVVLEIKENKERG
ncbi:Yip1 family protein [Oceanivirga miroungae]|uniref:Uncharacterized protein n=1 Tax=Oceanivirga miroungae TaxID=1130046 RepID=A0A6I8M9M2_9FUSO|nr:Yip1 family protein [Oceanivirga miroungae]VWL84995.1 hypothetical protein OMES3154_00267 [Oceanivirga miroungae]